ncbi:MAG: DUF58 domain-containing protein [Pirellulaceae bacterium]|nr:DUF58 domain-containing protein [Pirellulaceae bacterium]
MSRTRPFRTAACRETWYYLFVLAAIAGGAMYREINLLLVLAGMIGGPLFLSWLAVRANLRGIRVSRRLPRGVCAGDLLVVNLELTNASRRGSWAVVVEEQIRQQGSDTLRPRVYFPHVGANDKTERAYRGRLTDRGEYQVGPLRVSTRFPFGLLRCATTVGQSQSMVVYPRLGRLTQAWIARHQEAFEGAQQRQQRFTRVEGQFYGVRYWRNGDSRRSIHWRSSARRGQLVVRQFEQPHSRDVAVIVDPWLPKHPTEDERDRVELAVSFAATVVADLCRQGNAILTLATTVRPDQMIQGPTSTALMHDVMRELAVTRPTARDGLATLLETVLARIDGDHEIILVGTRDVDLEDPSRFKTLGNNPSSAAAIRRARVINVSDPALAKYFQVE